MCTATHSKRKFPTKWILYIVFWLLHHYHNIPTEKICVASKYYQPTQESKTITRSAGSGSGAPMPPKSEETESLEQPVQKLTHYNKNRLTILIYLYFLKRMNVGVIRRAFSPFVYVACTLVFFSAKQRQKAEERFCDLGERSKTLKVEKRS